ncbi:MAG: PIN domain-containing protein [Nanoarchaeota archaeon]
MIVDTSFVIDVMRNDTSAIEILNELIRRNEPQLLTSPTIFELFHGVARSSRPENERNKILGIIEKQIILNLDAKAAARAGELDGRLVKLGERISPIDSMIAAIALENDEAVLTKNKKDFSKIKGLRIVTY